MKKTFILTICLAVFAGLAISAGASESVLGIMTIEGDVMVTPSGEDKAVKCSPETVLSAGDRIVTGEGSRMDIAFDKEGSNLVRIKESSDVVIKLDGPDKIELVDGEVFAMLKGMEKGEVFRVRTPCAACAARGTGWNTATDGKVTTVSVTDNKVFVQGVNKDGSLMKKEFSVKKGFRRSIKRFERPGKVEKISRARMSRFNKDMNGLVKSGSSFVKPPKKPVGKKFLDGDKTDTTGLRDRLDRKKSPAPDKRIMERKRETRIDVRNRRRIRRINKEQDDILSKPPPEEDDGPREIIRKMD